jgi:hypothetical protein
LPALLPAFFSEIPISALCRGAPTVGAKAFFQYLRIKRRLEAKIIGG